MSSVRRLSKSGSLSSGPSKGPERLNLIPMIDILTTLLIFLLATSLVTQSRLAASAPKQLPEVTSGFQGAPRVRAEIAGADLFIQGERWVDFFNLASQKRRAILDEKWNAISERPEPVLFIADQNSNYAQVELLMRELSRMGYRDFQFLTRPKRMNGGTQ